MKEPMLYKIVRPPLAFLFKAVYRPSTEGKENIPKEGKIILAGNHTHLLNCFSVAIATKRCVHFVAKAELMKGIGKYIFPGLGIIPIDRSTNGKEAILETEKYLEDGKLIAIFPEGTVNRTDDPMMPFKGGAVKIALDTGSDIVPFAITGKYKPFKKGLKIKFMPAIKVEKGSLKATNKLLEQTVLNEVIKEGK
ncbi:MAG: lysophospholipid acyltransferase family protein [Acutalibacteraceae bacterium]|nr:lysophospholipid acyltransferase family protein [Acutalibacteraceae bacterium]